MKRNPASLFDVARSSVVTHLNLLLAVSFLAGLPAPANAQAASTEIPQPNQLILQEQKVLPPDAMPGNYFGRTVAISGATAVIGAIGDRDHQGAAYIYNESDGVWAEGQKLTADDGYVGDGFGSAVALEDDTLVVAGGGAVYVFQRESDTWVQTQKLTASDGVGGDNFGGAISLSGRALVVGASDAIINGQLYQGAAYVFVQANGIWREVQKLTSSDGVAFDNFGSAVAVHGPVIVVGAPSKNVDANNFITGEAYVFARSTGTWNETQALVANDSGLFAAFGSSVALSRNTALIGAPHATANGHPAQGAVYTFAVANGILTQTQMITSDNGVSNDGFGTSVALSGKRAVVGAPAAVNRNGSRGEVYPFRQVGGNWSQVGRITASDGTSDQSFGFTVALDQDFILVGNSSYLHSGAYFYGPPAVGRP
jgi:hypothetical protein